MTIRRRRRVRLAAVALVSVAAGPAGAVDGPVNRSQPPPRAAATSGLFANALFEQNIGQHPEAIAYRTSIAGGIASFTAAGVDLALPPPAGPGTAMPPTEHVAAPPALTRLRVAFVHPATPRIVGVEQTPTRVNYVLGNDPRRWRTGVPTFRGVRYLGLWRGVDLEYGAGAGPLKGTYTVAPHTSPEVIRWRYPAATVRLAGGELIVTPPGGGTLVERAPVAWQDGATGRQPVAVRYRLAADGTVGFTLGRYDPRRPLVIDPELVWSRIPGSYLTGGVEARDVAVDATGNVIVAGVLYSQAGGDDALTHRNAPQPRDSRGYRGQLDGYVAKFTAAGALTWLTYVGGAGSDSLIGVDVDTRGRVAVTGATNAVDYPTLRAAEARGSGRGSSYDAVLTVLRPDGTAEFSTYVPSAGNGRGNTVRFARDGSVTVIAHASPSWATGSLRMGARPTPGAYRVAFTTSMVVRYSATGRLVWRAALGLKRKFDPASSTSDPRDLMFLVGGDVAANGDVVLAGYTRSPFAPTTADAVQRAHSDRTGASWDGYFATLAADGGALRAASYYGGPGHDVLAAAGVTPDGSLWLLGQTESNKFPQHRPIQSCLAGSPGLDPRPTTGLTPNSDVTVLRLAPRGALALATCFGGGGRDEIGTDVNNPMSDLDVDAAGNVYLSGATCSLDFPSKDAWQLYRGNRVLTGGSGCDAFAASLRPDGQLRWSSPLGGSDWETAFGGIALGANGRLAITTTTGSHDFPGTQPPHDVPGAYAAWSAVTTVSER